MEWQIAATKATVCLRKFHETKLDYWLKLAEKHLANGNGYLQEIDRRSDLIVDPVDYVGAERCHAELSLIPEHSGFAVAGSF